MVRVASWRAAFSGLVPQDFLDAMDPTTIAASWSDSIAAGRSRIHVAQICGYHSVDSSLVAQAWSVSARTSTGGPIIGYAGVGPERDESAPAGTGELYALFVHPDWWGSGVGRALTNAALRDLRAAGCVRVQLWVLEANTRARAFYRSYGFSETADRTTSSLGELPELRLSRDL